MMREVEVARVADIPEEQAVGFRVDGLDVVICNVEGEIYAFQGMCSHEDLPLDGGEVIDGILTCDWHGATFDACTGSPLGLPATRRLKAFDTTVRDGRIYLLLDR